MADTAVIVAAISAVPAILAAVAAVIAARRSGAGNSTLDDVNTQIKELRILFVQHIENRKIHRG